MFQAATAVACLLPSLTLALAGFVGVEPQCAIECGVYDAALKEMSMSVNPMPALGVIDGTWGGSSAI